MNTHGYVMLPMVKHIRLSVHQHRVNYIGVNQGVVATSRVVSSLYYKLYVHLFLNDPFFIIQI